MIDMVLAMEMEDPFPCGYPLHRSILPIPFIPVGDPSADLRAYRIGRGSSFPVMALRPTFPTYVIPSYGMAGGMLTNPSFDVPFPSHPLMIVEDVERFAAIGFVEPKTMTYGSGSAWGYVFSSILSRKIVPVDTVRFALATFRMHQTNPSSESPATMFVLYAPFVAKA